ncbi:MAG TPA: TetR/AcrR family transcriptional regulator [Gammaproteobacteria bacterium]|nr:TetR/AcrR family transcriptional regulator [Gammaproteobacteria bacterium]
MLRPMPYPKDHKARTRQRILESALACFTRHGFAAVSIDQLMAHAGLTRGAFYAHFRSKSEVYAEAIANARHLHRERIAAMLPVDAPARARLRQFVEQYLSREHVNEPNRPCPLACLVTDVASGDAHVRATYTRIFEGMNRLLREMQETESDEDTLLAVSAMMIGTVAVCRALDDPALVERLLASSRRQVAELLAIETATEMA